MAFVEFNDVSKIYSLGEVKTVGLKDFSIKIEKSEFVSIVGPSGCGKTTLLNLLGGIDEPDTGSIISDGMNITICSKKVLNNYRREKVSFIFQFYNLIPSLTALENVLLSISLNSKSKNKIGEAKDWLAKVGLADHADKFPHQLSGGQQQKVSIARALAKNPSILLADEPTGSCDSTSAKEIIKILHQLNIENGLTIILVTHNPAVANCANRLIYLKDGLLFGEKAVSEEEKTWIEA